jgi:soluble lytic murein transglycosylase-like protein
MELTQLISLAKSKAQAHCIDPVLVCAVCEQESEWETWAIRYEPIFDKKYVAPHSFLVTEEIARSISWGLLQLMGENARELGFQGRLASLCDPFIGLEYGCQQLKKELLKAGGDTTKALLFWNGGGDPAYPKKVMDRMNKYR